MTSDEVRRFKILTNRFKSDHDKKLVQLFDGIRSEKYEDDDELIRELYSKVDAKTKNRYFRLRNKLLEDIGKSLVFYYYKYKDSIHALYDLQLCIMMKERGQYMLAYYYLKKGEKKALEQDQFHILELIFNEYIDLSAHVEEIDVEQLVKRRKQNLQRISVYRKNTEALGLIRQKFRKTRFTRKKKSVVKLLENLRTRLEDESEIFNSAQGKIRVINTVSTILYHKEAWQELFEYMTKELREMELAGDFTRDNHPSRLLFRLRVIYSLLNMDNFEGALHELGVLHEEMKMFGKQNYHTYLFNYYNSLIIALKSLNRQDELKKAFNAAFEDRQLLHDPRQLKIIQLSYAGHLYNSDQRKEALEQVRQIMKDEFKALDIEYRYHILIFLLILLMESGQYSEFEKHYKNLKKNFKRVLNAAALKKYARFIELLNRMNTAEMEGKSVSIKSTSKKFDEQFGQTQASATEVINPHVYLRARASETDYFRQYQEELKR